MAGYPATSTCIRGCLLQAFCLSSPLFSLHPSIPHILSALFFARRERGVMDAYRLRVFAAQ